MAIQLEATLVATCTKPLLSNPLSTSLNITIATIAAIANDKQVVNLAWLALPLRKKDNSEMDTYLYVFLHHGVYMIVATWFGLVLFRVGMPIPSLLSQVIIVIVCLIVAWAIDIAILQLNRPLFEYMLPAVTVAASIPFFVGAFITQVALTEKEKKDEEKLRKKQADMEAAARAPPPIVLSLKPQSSNDDNTVVVTTSVPAISSTPLPVLLTDVTSSIATETTRVPLVSNGDDSSASGVVTPSLQPIILSDDNPLAPAVVTVAAIRTSEPVVAVTSTENKEGVSSGSRPPPQHHYYQRFFLFLCVAAMILITYCASQYLVRIFLSITDESLKVLSFSYYILTNTSRLPCL
jgi:hypothetical protein